MPITCTIFHSLPSRARFSSTSLRSTARYAFPEQQHSVSYVAMQLSTDDARVVSFKHALHHLQGEKLVATHLTTQGRRVNIPLAALEAGVCQFSFKDLCEKPLGAADYLVIAESFPVVFVRDIPVLKLEMINQVRWWVRCEPFFSEWGARAGTLICACAAFVVQMRRFITFVDCMYDKGVRVRDL